MTERERQIMELLRQNPMLSQGELAKHLGITRSSVGVHLANLGKKGHILGKGYVLSDQEERYIVGVGAANIDLMGRSRAPLVKEDSNPGFIGMSVGGVTHNICENAARMGAPVRLITVTGDDVYGEKIRWECQAAGIDTSGFMVVEGDSSSIYLSLHHDTGEMAIAMSDMRVLQKLSVEFLKGKSGILRGAGAIVADCGLPEEILQYLAAAYGPETPIFVDPVSTTYARKLVGHLRGFHTLKPNLLEAEILAGMTIDSRETLDEAAQRLLQQGLTQVVISLGKEGVYYRDQDGRALRAWGKPMDQVVNATGAGDAFMGGLAYAFLQGWPPEKTLPFAVAASRMAISHQSTINPGISAENVLAVMEQDGITIKELS
ncbi:MAG: winged helix-turn-helix transcriptional regulator [Angelakisella sp.]|jgi:pseudouridine kinase|nr:winged helix-turn-helix transcriptional regulator [Angelakisella sp.]